MINLEQDHRWIIAIYKEKTLQEAKEEYTAAIDHTEHTITLRLTPEEYQALDLPVIPQEEE